MYTTPYPTTAKRIVRTLARASKTLRATMLTLLAEHSEHVTLETYDGDLWVTHDDGEVIDVVSWDGTGTEAVRAAVREYVE